MKNKINKEESLQVLHIDNSIEFTRERIIRVSRFCQEQTIKTKKDQS